jgi:hypothetical protein
MSCKKAIIIGNGSDVLKYENGHKIDNFDYVVRMGDAPRIKGYEKYVGTKTDMFRIKWFNMFYMEELLDKERHSQPRKTFDFDITKCDILNICQDPDEYTETAYTAHEYYDISLNRNFLLPIGNRYLHDLCIEKFNLKTQKWYFFNAYHNAELMSRMQLQNYKTNRSGVCEYRIGPSGGLCTLWFFLNFMPYSIYITGFDSWKTGHYWKPHIVTDYMSHSSIHERIFINKLIKRGYINVL